MKKIATAVSTMAMVAALAAPAMAQFSLGGYYRLTGVSQNIKSKSTDPTGETMIDQRLRMKMTDSLNDYVKLVYYAEVDTPWGMKSKGSIGGGGEVGTDGVNIETKNAYIDVKVPDTTVKARIGLQGIDDLFEYVVISEDAAAAVVSADVAGVNVEAIYSKFSEGSKSNWDDDDFYGLHVKKKFNEHFKLGGAIYYHDNNSTDPNTPDPAAPTPQDTSVVPQASTFYYGLTGDYAFKIFNINGFAIAQDGTETVAGKDIDSKALCASVRAAMLVPHGQVGLRAIYFSPDDSAKNDNTWKHAVGEWEFPRESLMIFLPDRWVNNSGTTRYAMVDAAEAGFGLYGLTATAFLKDLPLDTYANLGAGAFWAASDKRNDASGSHVGGTLIGAGDDVRAGSTLGYELSAEVGKKVAKMVDVSLRGAYAIFGDFYDDTVVNRAGQASAPDNVFKTALMVNVGF